MIIIIFSVFVSSFAHIFLKKGMSSFGSLHEQELSLYPLVLNVALNPWVIGGISLHVVALVIWLTALSRVEISFAYPFLALGYVLVGIMAWAWLGESITIQKVMGTLIIIFGLIVISRSA